jgi:hypothetical protein
MVRDESSKAAKKIAGIVALGHDSDIILDDPRDDLMWVIGTHKEWRLQKLRKVATNEGHIYELSYEGSDPGIRSDKFRDALITVIETLVPGTYRHNK